MASSVESALEGRDANGASAQWFPARAAIGGCAGQGAVTKAVLVEVVAQAEIVTAIQYLIDIGQLLPGSDDVGAVLRAKAVSEQGAANDVGLAGHSSEVWQSHSIACHAGPGCWVRPDIGIPARERVSVVQLGPGFTHAIAIAGERAACGSCVVDSAAVRIGGGVEAVVDGAFVVGSEQPTDGMFARYSASGIGVAYGAAFVVSEQPADAAIARYSAVGICVADDASLVIAEQPADDLIARCRASGIGVADGASVVVSGQPSDEETARDAATHQPDIANYAAGAGIAEQTDVALAATVDGEVAEGMAQAIEPACEGRAVTT